MKFTVPGPAFATGAATLLAGAGLLLSACATTTATTVPDADESPVSSPGDAEDGAAVEVRAVDYAYQDLPASIAAGTQILLHNDSAGEMHELIAMRVPDDENRPVSELIELPEAELEGMFAGEPAAVILAPPGEQGFPVVGDGVMGEPGRYIVICAIPTGADPQEYLDASDGEGPPQVDGGPPHFLNGMWAELVVEAG